MTRTWAVVALVSAWATVAQGQDVSLAALVGVQLLQQQSIGQTHGALLEEVSLGRTVLGGVSLDLQPRDRHHLAVEAVIGPYHNDIDRYCIYSERSPCPPYFEEAGRANRYAVLYGFDYSYVFPGHRQSPFVGVGVGGKTYFYDRYGTGTSVTIHAAAGVEVAARAPIRLEGRFVVVPNNPYLQPGVEFQGTGSATQYELQLRASVRLRLSK